MVQTRYRGVLNGPPVGAGETYNHLAENWGEVVKEYRAAEKFLNISEGSRNVLDLKSKIEKQAGELENQKKEMNDTVNAQARLTVRMEDKIQTLQSEFEGAEGRDDADVPAVARR